MVGQISHADFGYGPLDSDKTSITPAALSLRSTRIAKLSRVNSSSAQSILITRLSAVRSWAKS